MQKNRGVELVAAAWLACALLAWSLAVPTWISLANLAWLNALALAVSGTFVAVHQAGRPRPSIAAVLYEAEHPRSNRR